MICKTCKKKNDQLDLYCLHCGTPSESYKLHFKVSEILKRSNEAAKKQKSNFHFYYIIVALIILLAVYLANFNIISDNYLFNYVFLNISMVILLPILMLPFSPPLSEGGKGAIPPLTEGGRGAIPPLTEGGRGELFKFYPKLLIFTLIVVLYFAFLKLICQTDPILNLVRLVLVVWGIAIVFPVPFLIFNDNNNTNIIRIIYKAYNAGKYLRWQQFSLCFILAIMNSVAVLLLLIPLPSTLNFTANVMNIWHQKQQDFMLYDKNKDY